MSIVKRKGDDDDLHKAFANSWKKVRGNPAFKTLPSEVDLPKAEVSSVKDMEKYIEFFRSDHMRFWFVGQPDFAGFPAILLTDTGKFSFSGTRCLT